MKNLRRFFSAALLTFVFAAAALADDGIIHGDSPEPKPSSATTNETTVVSQSPDATTNSADVSSATDAVVGVALQVVGDMFTIL